MKIDPTTLGIIIMTPILQIIVFGYAINFYPKNLPAALISYDESPLTRKVIQAIKTTQYMEIVKENVSEREAADLLKEGKVNYIITIPPQFTHDFVRGNKPSILLEADAGTNGIMGQAVLAVQDLPNALFDRELQGSFYYLHENQSPFKTDLHALYNPNLESTISVIPCLIGIILLLSLATVTSLTIVDEKEAGNIEVLLNSNIKPLEIMVGKFLSYLIIGYIQLFVILFLCIDVLFHVPMRGSLITLAIVSLPFLMSSLMMGLIASTLAKSQMQAQSIVQLFFLPSIMLSGFIFPFYGMPSWAQLIGNILPITHYMRITSGIMLKDYSWWNIFPDLWQIILFTMVITLLAVMTFKRTLD